jgi:hypothetical protein
VVPFAPDELRQDQKIAAKTLMGEGQNQTRIGEGMKPLADKRVVFPQTTKIMAA